MLNAISAWWHMVGVLVVVAVLVIVPDHPQVGRLRLRRNGEQHGILRMNFGTSFSSTCSSPGLLMAQYTITGYDASAHMSEETRQASLGAAWGIVMVGRGLGDLRIHPVRAVTFALPDAHGDFVGAGQQILTFYTGRPR